MLNIIKYKLKNSYNNLTLNTKFRNKSPNKFVPNTRNWKNSIYTFNKNNLNNINYTNKFINKLIKVYFNLYNFKLERILRSRKSYTKNIKKRNISKNKILISLGQFKHTNDLINITIYFYNKELLSYMSTLKRRYLNIFYSNNNYLIAKKLYIIKKLGLKILKRESELKKLLLKTLINKDKVKNIRLNLYKVYIRKSLYKEYKNLYFNFLIFINKSKFNNYYLHYLTNLIKKITKKNIQFNFINLKYYYLNSYIFTNILLLKLSTAKKKILSAISKSVSRTNLLDENINVKYNSKYLKDLVLENVNYKKISGVRLEIRGRLTKRFTASRSIHKLKYKGNLINFKSSEKFESSALIRGNIRPNLEYTKLQSVARIGSYGVKGWISGI